ncbi:ATP-binding protein [Streptomyces diastatochromogenes]|nr:ATP-binding protein [Streptomyces diastatochromogenes]
MRGHAGSGKSALLGAAVRAATTAGLRVLRGAGVRGGEPSALSGLRQILRPVLGPTGRSLSGGRSGALETLLADGAPSPADRSRLAFSVLETLEAVGTERPLLVAVDDWDALDEPSREVLSFVARRTSGSRMALLLTARPHRTRLAPLDGLPELRLGPLTPDESARLLAARRPGLDVRPCANCWGPPPATPGPARTPGPLRGPLAPRPRLLRPAGRRHGTGRRTPAGGNPGPAARGRPAPGGRPAPAAVGRVTDRRHRTGFHDAGTRRARGPGGVRRNAAALRPPRDSGRDRARHRPAPRPHRARRPGGRVGGGFDAHAVAPLPERRGTRP